MLTGAVQGRPTGGLPHGLPVGSMRRLFVPLQLAPQPRTEGCEQSASQLPSLHPTLAGGPGGAGGGGAANFHIKWPLHSAKTSPKITRVLWKSGPKKRQFKR